MIKYSVVYADKKSPSKLDHRFKRWWNKEHPNKRDNWTQEAWEAWHAAWALSSRTLHLGLVTNKPKELGWIEHHGESDPSMANPLIEVRFADGDTALGRFYDWDQNWQWKPGEHHGGNIVAYRIMPIVTLREKVDAT